MTKFLIKEIWTAGAKNPTYKEGTKQTWLVGKQGQTDIGDTTYPLFIEKYGYKTKGIAERQRRNNDSTPRISEDYWTVTSEVVAMDY